MDPSRRMFDMVVYPTALFEEKLSSESGTEDALDSWPDSFLNPKNRHDSLDPSQGSQWRIDGGEVDGTRFFAVPAFALGNPPMRIDTYIPDQNRLDSVLQSKSLFLVGGKQVSALPISQYVVRALQFWSTNYEGFEKAYMDMPFGSHIVVEPISTNVRQAKVHFAPTYEIEEQWLSVRSLKEMWRIDDHKWPPTMSLDNLQFQRQIHDAITLVSIRGHGSHTFVFKSLVHDLKYMYHELKMLLTMEPHTNIISRPIYIITRRCRFGGKIGVCGFILEYYPLGNLRDGIIARSRSKTASIQENFRWAIQVTSALIHIQDSPLGFYSNLKLDNIVLSSRGHEVNAILIDFEQRSSSYSWSPPEVCYLEYLEYLASAHIRPSLRDSFVKLLRVYEPQWEQPHRTARYKNSRQGYSIGWLALTPLEVEKAQVFMLGKILWCIFEGLGSVNGNITMETFREEISDQAFPEFRRTHEALKGLIKRCTAGANEWRGAYPTIVRYGSKLFPRGKRGICDEELGTANDVQEAARAWWKEELKQGLQYLECRRRFRQGYPLPGDLETLGFLNERPRLAEVLRELNEAEARCCRT